MKFKIHRNTGFSLLELLVVIVIIGIAVSVATLAFGDSQAERMSHKSKQLAALIELAKEQAIFNSQELGILFTKDSYTFYKMDISTNKNNEEKIFWLPIEDDRILSKRTLPDGLEYELYLEGVQVAFTASKLKEITPHVFILSDGSLSPFELNLTDKSDHNFMMKMAENGKYEMDTGS
jgi:general secretion pathway protein H